MSDKIKGKDLIFICRIKRDGSWVEPVKQEDVSHLNDTKFTVCCLSITFKTYIACEFNSYVVKLKKEP